MDSHIVSPWAHGNDTHKSLSLVWSVMIGWELFVWFHLHVSSECSNLGIVLEFVSKGGLGCCFSVRMNVQCVCSYLLTTLIYCLVKFHTRSASDWSDGYLYISSGYLIFVDAWSINVFIFRWQWKTVWEYFWSVRIFATYKIISYRAVFLTLQKHKPPKIQRTLPVRDIQPEPDSTD